MPDEEETVVPPTSTPAPARAALPPREERESDPLRNPATTEASISDIRKRERRAALKDAYGTYDEEEIAKIKQTRKDEEEARRKKDEELENLRKDRQEQERAKLSEVERLTADVAQLKTENQQLKEQVAQAKQETLGERQSANIKLAAARHKFKTKPAVMKLILQDFGAHFVALPNSEKRRYQVPAEAEKALDKWMRIYAKDNPELLESTTPAAPVEDPAAPAAPAATAPVAKSAAPSTRPVVRRPMGGPPTRPVAPAKPVTPGSRQPGMNAAGKVVKPGQPNSMNAAELAAYNKELGLGRRAG